MNATAINPNHPTKDLQEFIGGLYRLDRQRQGRPRPGSLLIWQGWRAAPSARRQTGATNARNTGFRPLNAAGDIAARCPCHPNQDIAPVADQYQK